eukprot:7379944-Prymnesium_polylepis.1
MSRAPTQCGADRSATPKHTCTVLVSCARKCISRCTLCTAGTAGLAPSAWVAAPTSWARGMHYLPDLAVGQRLLYVTVACLEAPVC